MTGNSRRGSIPRLRATGSDTGDSRRALRLRRLLESDLQVLFDHQPEPEANRLAAFPAREPAAFMEHWHGIMADRKVMIRTILFHGQVTGYVMRFPWHEKQEIGYWIGRAFWGQGIATEAVSQFLRFCKTRPLFAGVARQNLPSMRVLEKCNFRPLSEDPEEIVYRLE